MVSDHLSRRTSASGAQGGIWVDTYIMRGAGGRQVIWGENSSGSLRECLLARHQEQHHQHSLLGGAELKSLYFNLDDGFG